MTFFPFKKEEKQKIWSLIVSLTGILLLAVGIGLDNTPKFIIGKLSISYSSIGFIMFFIGLIYLIESLSK